MSEEVIRINNKIVPKSDINNQLLTALENNIKAKNDILHLIETLFSLNAVDEDLLYTIEGWKAEFVNNVVKVSIPDSPIILHMYTANSNLNYQRKRWIGNIAYAIKTLGVPQRTEKVCIYIKYSFPVLCDIDNSFFKPIIDGIKYSGIIKNDTFQCVNIVHEGELTKGKSHTEIYILPEKNVKILGADF